MDRFELFEKVDGDCIYCIFSSESNKMYIGKTGNILKRKEQHKRALKLGSHSNKELQKDYNKGYLFTMFPVAYGEKVGGGFSLRYHELNYIILFMEIGYKLYNKETKRQAEILMKNEEYLVKNKMYIEMSHKRDDFYKKYLGMSFNRFLAVKHKDWYMKEMQNEIIREKDREEKITVSFRVPKRVKKALKESGHPTNKYIKKLVIEDYNNNHDDYVINM